MRMHIENIESRHVTISKQNKEMEKAIHIKNITDGVMVKLEEDNELNIIGFDKEGNVHTVPITTSDKFTDLPSSMVVPLLRLTKCQHGGLMLAPYSRDVACVVNKDFLLSEINLIEGSIIEVADKKLKIIECPVAPVAKERRQLPPTPGISVSRKPPPKPGREKEKPSGVKDKEMKDWCTISCPSSYQELLENMKTSKQIGDLAASFLTKQVNVYTDSKLSAKFTDQIFKFLQEVVDYQKHIVLSFLKEVTSHLDEMPESERDRPMHAPAIKLLVELLRQILDPLSHVILCLQLLRKFSHFPQNLPVIIKCQAAAAVMGCMAVYLQEEEVQLNCLDILAKITSYHYQLTEKVQIRETGLEMILRSLKHHPDNEHILQSGCRTLTNLTTSLQTTMDCWLDVGYKSDPDVEEGITKYEELLNYIFTNATPTVQTILQNYEDNIGIKTEGRRFLFNLSKMKQLQTRKNSRSLVGYDDEIGREVNIMEQLNENLVKPTLVTSTKPTEPETKSILRHDGAKLAAGAHKVHFVDEYRESVTSFSSSDDEDYGEKVEFVKRKEVGGAVIEVLETRKLTKTEIHNFKMKQEFELLSSFESSKEEDILLSKQSSSDSEFENSGETQETAENFEKDVSNLDFKSDVHIHESAQINKELTDSKDTQFSNNSNHYQNVFDNSVKGGDKIEHICCEKGDVVQIPSSFSGADVEILTKVIRTKVVQHVSLLVIEGKDSEALKDIDLPLEILLEKSQSSTGLIGYAKRQYADSKTLLDVDPAFLISIVDAVRYSSLLSELLRNSLLDVVSGLPENMDGFMMHVAISSIKSVFTCDELHSIVTEENFTKAMKASLHSKVQKSKDLAAIFGKLN